MSLQILVLNSGSSSIKYGLYRANEQSLQRYARGVIDRIGQQARFYYQYEDKQDQVDLPTATDHISALQYLLERLQDQISSESQLLVGHRVVHGGTAYSTPVRINDKVLQKLKSYVSLAPLHQPYNLMAIEALMQIDERLCQVACFDTAFHAQHQKPINQFGIPQSYYDQGIRRYGFHGLSYESVIHALQQQDPELASGSVIAAHLGNGASLCAMKNGVSVDSTTGFSALDGLMMGTRSGTIDAGVLLYLLQEQQMSVEALTDLLYNQSGLKGVSGISNDMRDLLASDKAEAKEAIELYVHRIIVGIGGMTASLGGVDGLIFSGGIGENAAVIRQQVCDKLHWLQLQLDQEANAANSECISVPSSKLKVYVIPTNEELMIAKHTLNMVDIGDNEEKINE